MKSSVESAAPAAKPQLSFAVSDVERTAKELRRRGLILTGEPFSATVTDPDGTRVEFVSTDQTVPKDLLDSKRNRPPRTKTTRGKIDAAP